MSKGLYPIRTISAMTGVNPVTLRAWERRYGLIQPQRTAKGHRLYTESDINRIQNILVLLERGIPISQASQVLDDSEIPATAEPAAGDDVGELDSWQRHLANWRRALETFDERAIDAACGDTLSLFPVEAVLERLARPLLAQLAEEGRENDLILAHRHLLQATLRNRLGARFLHQGTRGQGPILLTACPAGESDDISLMLLSVEAQANGYRVVLLGTDVDSTSLAEAVRASHCAGLVLSSRSRRPPRGLLDAMADMSCPVFLLDEAASWNDLPASNSIPIPEPQTALRVIGRRLPPAQAGANRGIG
ncbi:MerR family transcriptional regulator [Methylonatrum kenyense]|uniref:MerR family transcriptional regulator n=1 Tax=Methylonatrum kenyense TaxID=455253 RepID=UPI0020BF0F44|nr:MerR family transcriptional regulator [Methylonatrum kenyense]MCK8517041.1 MerR family transcriptional regulator [Methylonatrum kenyense]